MQTLNAASSGRMMGPLPEITAAVSFKITLIYINTGDIIGLMSSPQTLMLSNCWAQVWPGPRLSCLNQSLSGGAGGAWAPTSASRAGSRERATGSIVTTGEQRPVAAI